MKILFRLVLLIMLAPVAWFSLLLALDMRQQQIAAATPPRHEKTIDELLGPPRPCGPKSPDELATPHLGRDEQALLRGYYCSDR